MRLVSYNIRFGGGTRLPYIGEVITALAPDLVLLQEATNPTSVDRIAAYAGMGHVLRRPGWSVAAVLRTAPRAHEWHRPRRGRGFLAIEPEVEPGLAREPSAAEGEATAAEGEATAAEGPPRATPAAFAPRIVNVHLAAGLSNRGERARLYQVADLVDWLGGAADERTVLAGDFNAVAPGDVPHVAGMPFWLRMLLRFDGGFRTEVHTRLAAAGWIDAFRHLSPGDPGGTLPAGAPQVRLDYTLVPPAILPLVRSCAPADQPLAARASDHLPLLTVLGRQP